MEAILPAGIVDATRKLLVASGAAGARTITGKMGTSYRIFVKRKINNFYFILFQLDRGFLIFRTHFSLYIFVKISAIPSLKPYGKLRVNLPCI